MTNIDLAKFLLMIGNVVDVYIDTGANSAPPSRPSVLGMGVDAGKRPAVVITDTSAKTPYNVRKAEYVDRFVTQSEISLGRTDSDSRLIFLDTRFSLRCRDKNDGSVLKWDFEDLLTFGDTLYHIFNTFNEQVTPQNCHFEAVAILNGLEIVVWSRDYV